MMGCRGAGHAGLKFTNLVLDPKYLLGEEGQGMEIAIHSLSVSRVHIAISNLACPSACLRFPSSAPTTAVTLRKPIASRQMIKPRSPICRR